MKYEEKKDAFPLEQTAILVYMNIHGRFDAQRTS